MKQVLLFVKNQIISLLDFFYPPFSKFVDRQTFRYAVSGGSNTAFDILLYFITYNFVLQKQVIHIGWLAISPHIAAFVFTFPITFVSGFLLARYIVFPESTSTKKRIQLSRYLLIVLICILLNYVFLKLFVEYMSWWPLPAKLATTVIVVMFSYFSQKKFAFRNQEIKNP